MTTFRSEKVNCAVCGAENERCIMTSTTTFGGPDLDFRPPMVEREALWMNVTVCSECGFAAQDLSVSQENAAELVRGVDYQNILKPQGKAALRGAFGAAAYLAGQAGRFSEAGWLYVYAAWASDDQQADPDAIACRESAIEQFGQAQNIKQQFCGDAEAEMLLLIDLNRRSRHFFDAQRQCHDCLGGGISDGVRRLIEYEALLITKKDDQCHAMSECSQQEADHES